MKSFRLSIITLALALPLAAQNGCGFERAQNVPASWAAGPLAPCDYGINITIGGVNVQPGGTQCPLFVIITPLHQQPEPVAKETEVEFVAFTAEQTAFFTCVPHYIIFIPLSSTCEHTSTQNTGQLPLLRTVGCGKRKGNGNDIGSGSDAGTN